MIIHDHPFLCIADTARLFYGNIAPLILSGRLILHPVMKPHSRITQRNGRTGRPSPMACVNMSWGDPHLQVLEPQG